MFHSSVFDVWDLGCQKKKFQKSEPGGSHHLAAAATSSWTETMPGLRTRRKQHLHGGKEIDQIRPWGDLHIELLTK